MTNQPAPCRRRRSQQVVCVALLTLAALIDLAAPPRARAFCGFYVAGADTSLYANASMVVLMRHGTKTVLSMQNNYQGPPEDFALVVPVPTVLTEEQVKILPAEVFDHVDTLGAPRLVEYWERDPCNALWDEAVPGSCAVCGGGAADAGIGSVTVEATFTVGEYDVVVLSASDSMGLDTWLRDNDYNIPEGAEPILAPYVADGTKFFVAKVDPERVTFVDGQAALSPLRFHFDSPDFWLPVRLGLLNSQGTQDLIINILAEDRYEVANYPNVTIPTNIRVHDQVRDGFGAFYEGLFAEVLAQHPDAVVTEYSWDSSTCDPCPTEPLGPSDLATLGADVTVGLGSESEGVTPPSYTLTRLHYRYSEDTLGDDLVFEQAPPIIGGRGVPNTEGELEDTDASSAQINNFQGRYIILHPWTDPFTCDDPQRGYWGGPEGEGAPMTQGSRNTALTGESPAAADLPALLAESLPELGVNATHPLDPFVVWEGPTSSGTDEDAGANGDASAEIDASPASDGGPGSADTDGGGCSCRVGRTSGPFPAGTGLLVLLALGRLHWRGRNRHRARR